ncbi:TPA: hypothetical protein ACNU8V_005468 [Pseudomonas aeruginosa]
MIEQTPEQAAALERLADKLEADLMPCPLPRAELLEFLRGQVEALRCTPPPTAADAAWLIDNAYIQWVALALEQ